MCLYIEEASELSGLVLQELDATMNRDLDGVYCILGTQYMKGKDLNLSSRERPNFSHSKELFPITSSGSKSDNLYVEEESPGIPTSFNNFWM